MGKVISRPQDTFIPKQVAPPDAQKNSDITKAEIEAKLIGEISSHYHSGGTPVDITKQYIESILTGEISSHTHTSAITALITKTYIETLLSGTIKSHNHPTSSFTYFP